MRIQSSRSPVTCSIGVYEGPFLDLPQESLCCTEIWCEYAWFAVESLDLKAGTIVEYMRKAMRLVSHCGVT
jgi:hypothetical protein